MTISLDQLERSECACEGCVRACRYTPGLFRPGEAEKVAGHMGITLKELFDTRLGVNWYSGEEAPIFMLQPVLTHADPGEEFPRDPRGTCTFLTHDGRCEIHDVKPFACAVYRHDWTDDQAQAMPALVAAEWDAHQDQITELLGREPEASEPMGLLDLLYGGHSWL